jgi:hypothetical protein
MRVLVVKDDVAISTWWVSGRSYRPAGRRFYINGEYHTVTGWEIVEPENGGDPELRITVAGTDAAGAPH